MTLVSFYSFFLEWGITAGGVANVGERVTFSSPDENARAGETAQKPQCQPTLATPLVMGCCYLSFNSFRTSFILITILFASLPSI